MSETIELSSVTWPGSTSSLGLGASVFVNGEEASVTRIYLKQDGAGPSGMYDNIHIEAGDKPWMSGPAHNAEAWEYK